MSDADTLLRSGDLDGARSALVETVRAEPANQQARMFLFQLLAAAGEWDKARRQLDTLAQLSGEAQMLAVAYGQAIDAERERAEVFAGRARARQHVASDWLEGVIDAIEHFAQGRIAEGEGARDAAFDAAPDVPGSFNDIDFDWIADADARFGPSFEAIIGGRYGLQAFDQVASITSEGPRDLRDLIWYPVQIAFRSGQSVAAFLPARYPGSEAAAEVSERLGRTTSWADAEWGQAGSGQRLWTLSDGEDQALLSLRTLSLR
ncbi:type VI secretion system protein ImpE [Sphingomonas kyeonggiensis]|uniref:type VI secretion system accessory protein TagJ n=1 Tax=Sphingomonas kyeonggiensis TaxID=1268553 RepID=UPI002787A944|nr:type VI secretion system accessory protein TagJ [Sphingomonas kyeonggiensis]MDQ0250304.1 type VI secretion system protein ImpE [Sphingomonas kyeonggiensis]